MDSPDKRIETFNTIRERLLMNSSVKDIKYAEEIARRWLKA